MGKLVKKTIKAVAKTVVGIPQTAINTGKDVAHAGIGAAQALAGQGGGNYFKNLGTSAENAAAAGANLAVTVGSGGTTSLNDPSKGGNSLDGQIDSLLGTKDAPEMPTDAGIPTEVEDPALKEELANSRKRGRASTVLGGGTDSVGGASAKRSLLA